MENTEGVKGNSADLPGHTSLPFQRLERGLGEEVEAGREAVTKRSESAQALGSSRGDKSVHPNPVPGTSWRARAINNANKVIRHHGGWDVSLLLPLPAPSSFTTVGPE